MLLAVMFFGCIGSNAGCTEVFDPVCGADGKTYPNECSATEANVFVIHKGICKCSDSDQGKEIFVKGSLSTGEEDSCKDNETVNEYYCDGTVSDMESISCPKDYSCSDGACEKIEIECADSDGDDLFTKGTTTYGANTFYDTCIDADNVMELSCVDGTLSTNSEPCPEGYACSDGACSDKECIDTDGYDIFVSGLVKVNDSEFFDSCSDKKNGTEYQCGKGAEAVRFVCPSGFSCSEGRCVATCEDLDGGIDYYKKGSVVFGNELYPDLCQNTVQVKEYYCSEKGFSISTFNCPGDYLCIDGRCKAKFCEDTDGKDIYVHGKISKGAEDYEDNCQAENKVREYFCLDDKIKYLDFECPEGYGCFYGVCTEETGTCNDSDGGIEEYKKGTVTTEGKSGSDFCANSKEVNEYYCSTGDLALTTLPCGEGYTCKNGACTETCEETDVGKEYGRAGTTYYGNQSFPDYCAGELAVEYYCAGGSVYSESHKCDEGTVCEEGVCVPVCTDSDDGNDPMTGGKVSYGSEIYEDYCLPEEGNKVGREYFCGESGPSYESFYCEYGYKCHDGACNPSCEDTDGNDKFTQGTVYKGKESMTDACSTETSGTEYVCSSGEISEVQFECFVTHACQEGKCVPKT